MLDQMARVAQIGAFQTHNFGGFEALQNSIETFGIGNQDVVYHAYRRHHFSAGTLGQEFTGPRQYQNDERRVRQVLAHTLQITGMLDAQQIKVAGNHLPAFWNLLQLQDLVSRVHAAADSSKSWRAAAAT